jgi:hypothetical protein
MDAALHTRKQHTKEGLSMDMESIIKAVLTTLVILGVAASGIGGCTYMVTENNRMYYETMRQCIESSGTFVPTKGDYSSAVCIRK